MRISFSDRSARGFTLIEILLSLAIIALLAGLGTPVYQSFYLRNELDVAESLFVQSARGAQARAHAMDGDSDWGVHVTTGTITMFRGASFSARDEGFDEVADISDAIVLSGLQEIVFDVFTGDPGTTGTLNMNISSGETRSITISNQGVLDY